VGVVPAYVTAVPSVTSAVPRRSKAWIWWTLGVALLMLLIVGSCTIPFVLLAGKGFNSGATGGGGAVAVIHVDGVIAGSGSNVSGVVTPEYFYELLKRAEEDVRVKAIVLRVDSPGGTVAASEEIARYIKQCSKPVVVSVGDVGASGAYMIASQSDEIWAMPGSAVGSIGVISEIPNVGALLGKVGVNFQVITAGKYKDAGSLYRPLSKEERALIQGSVNEAYGQFIDIVAEGRSLPRSQVESMATGWAWNGEEAKKLGLIDRLGTYQDAMDAAAKRGGIKGKYETITYEDQFGDLLGSLLGISRQLGNLEALSGNRDAAVRSALPR
jgi:protease-4